MLSYRQINLDFHTSEEIDSIGKEFNKEQFQNALKKGHVNSITLFAKCHHGWAYYPSTANEIHPNLNFDLLGEQIEAAHEIGIKTPIYISAGYDEKMAVRHPEWWFYMYNANDPDFTVPMFHGLCFNTEYTDYLLEQIKEFLVRYDADGVFVDISSVKPCVCKTCKDTLIKMGKDPGDENDVWFLAQKTFKNFCKRVRQTVDSVKPGLPVFHNGGHIHRGNRELCDVDSHFEIESLPTGGWGYDDFMISAAYVSSLDKEYLGMTGKFNKSWGEFGGYKTANALRYETSIHIANGAKCSVGDQLHPCGRADETTYDIIGKAYKEVEEKEAWLIGAKKYADIGVFGIEAFENYRNQRDGNYRVSKNRLSSSDTGVLRILNEGHYLFDYIDIDFDFSKYKLIILPDRIEIDETISEKLRQAADSGTKILLSGNSGLIDESVKNKLDFGCRVIGKCEYYPTYLRPHFKLKTFESAAFVVYTDAYDTEITGGDNLGFRENPYFNRTVEHFCSHLQTPTNTKLIDGAIVKGKDGIYIAFDIFKEYSKNGSVPVKEIVCGIIDKLLDKTIETDLPQQGLVTLTEQKNRRIIHLIYGAVVSKGNGVDIVEDIVPIYNTRLKVRAKNVSKVYLAPQMRNIHFSIDGDYVNIEVPEIDCHQMVILE